MNALELIRTFCNMSQTLLAEKLGVSRQAVNLWESSKRPLSEKRCQQLSAFFNIDSRYFTIADTNELLPLFNGPVAIHRDGNREYYTFVSKEEFEKASLSKMRKSSFTHLQHMESTNEVYSHNDKLLSSRQQLSAVCEQITDAAAMPNRSVIENIRSVNRILRIEEPLIDAVKEIDNKPGYAKMLYFDRLFEIVTAICLSFGMVTEEDVRLSDKVDPRLAEGYGISGERIIKYARMFSDDIAPYIYKYMRERDAKAYKEWGSFLWKGYDFKEAENTNHIDELIQSYLSKQESFVD